MFKGIKSALFSLSCQHYTELASRRLDERLCPVDRIKFLLHHVVCTFCRRSNRQLKLIERGAAKIVVEDGSGTSLSDDAKLRIKEALSQRQ